MLLFSTRFADCRLYYRELIDDEHYFPFGTKDFLSSIVCGFQTSNQQRYYERCGKASVDEFLNGYNATIIAFGQVGSGKTYTITGDTKVTP